MYSVYAALCGCTSIVVPQAGVSREDWFPEESRRLGIAYGESDLLWADESRPDLLQRMKDERKDEDRLVRNFVHKCAERFGPA
jgi:hypothetical protein